MTEVLPKLRLTNPESKTVSPLTSPTPQGGATYARKSIDRPRSAQKSHANGKHQAPLRSDTSSPANGGTKAGQNGSGETLENSNSTIDPLSQHIFQRTTTTSSLQQKILSPTESVLSRSQTAKDLSQDNPKSSGEVVRSDSPAPGNKEKKKGVSFLSRFIGGGNKKKNVAEISADIDTDGAADDRRQEGMNAEVFSQPIDNIGYNPKHPQPPAYIKVAARFKKEKEFDRVFLAQELRSQAGNKKRPAGNYGSTYTESAAAGGHAIWALEFSKDGKHLAAGGQDRIVRVWAVISSAEERCAHENDEEATGKAGGESQRLSAPVFRKKAVREYKGHESTILDLSWSKNNFLLSSSMDKTVRLWHTSRDECLCTFKHTDYVPSIQFHPRDDRFFLAGSLDSKLRLWSIPDKSVAYWNQLPDMITAVSFTPDGKTAIAGTLHGLCQFYDTEGLKYQTQIHVKSTHGRNARGSKITAIQTTALSPDSPPGDMKILISSNDSRVRQYNFRDKGLDIKFKGHENNHSQIRASPSDDGRYVITGSEDKKVYIYSTSTTEGDKQSQRPLEVFEAHTSITTCAIMAPVTSRQLLSASEDPVYDICNPPPVTLMSKDDSIHSSKPPTEDGSVQATPVEHTFKRAEESPAYIARSVHNGGHLIVTADHNGSIKIFRQDCAFTKRRSEVWETSSVISRRVGSTIGRTMSIASRNSGRYSRRDSINTQPPNDRIMSWRQDIFPGNSADSLSLRGGAGKHRSVSPRKSLGAFSVASSFRKRQSEAPSSEATHSAGTSVDQGTTETTPKIDSEKNPLWVQGKQSYAFWNTAPYKEQQAHLTVDRGRKLEPTDARGRPLMEQKTSDVSTLSDEESDIGFESAAET